MSLGLLYYSIYFSIQLKQITGHTSYTNLKLKALILKAVKNQQNLMLPIDSSFCKIKLLSRF